MAICLLCTSLPCGRFTEKSWAIDYVEMDKTVPNELMCFTGEDLFEHESDYEKMQRNLDWRDKRLNISPFINIDGYEHHTRLFGEFKRDGHLIKISQK